MKRTDFVAGDTRAAIFFVVRRWAVEMRLRRLEREREMRALWPTLFTTTRHGVLDFVVSTGGFRLPWSAIEPVGAAANAFLRDFGREWQGSIETRSYAYYAADSRLHPASSTPTPAERLDVVIERWSALLGAMEQIVLEMPKRKSPIQKVVALAASEWLVNDLSTFIWTGRRLLVDPADTKHLEEALFQVSQLQARLGLFERAERRLKTIENDELAAIVGRVGRLNVQSVMREISVNSPLDKAEASDVRGLREGDQFWCCRDLAIRIMEIVRALMNNPRVLLISEAFGGIHMGHSIAAAVLQDGLRADVTVDIQSHSVHEDEMGYGRAGFGHIEELGNHDLAIHLDDSLFTGRTHHGLKLAAPAADVRLAAATLDLGTPMNHPEELAWAGRSPIDQLAKVEGYARSLDGRLPAYASFWARRKGGLSCSSDRLSEAERIRYGSDRLLASLWTQFHKEIHD